MIPIFVLSFLLAYFYDEKKWICFAITIVGLILEIIVVLCS